MVESLEGPCLEGELPDHGQSLGGAEVAEVVRFLLTEAEEPRGISGAVGHERVPAGRETPEI